MPSPESSRRNLEHARQRGRIKLHRCRDESKTIKLLIWQAYFAEADGKRPSQHALARQLHVSQPYVWRVMKKAHAAGWDALVKNGGRVSLDSLAEARRVTERVREREPRLFAWTQPRVSKESRVMTADEEIAETWREVAEWKRKNRSYSGGRVLFSVPVRW